MRDLVVKRVVKDSPEKLKETALELCEKSSTEQSDSGVLDYSAEALLRIKFAADLKDKDTFVYLLHEHQRPAGSIVVTESKTTPKGVYCYNLYVSWGSQGYLQALFFIAAKRAIEMKKSEVTAIVDPQNVTKEGYSVLDICTKYGFKKAGEVAGGMIKLQCGAKELYGRMDKRLKEMDIKITEDAKK
jgi:hypothetical protein